MATLNAKLAETLLIAYARGMPQAWEDHPWDHAVLKVGKKIFVFFGGAAVPKPQLSVTFEHPLSAETALAPPLGSPAGHRLGDSCRLDLRPTSRHAIQLQTTHAWLLPS